MNYAVTLTLKSNLFRFTPEEQYAKLRDEVTEKLREYKKSVFVELTKSFNIHAHCIIYFKKYREPFDIFRQSKIIGFICVKNPNNEQGWMDYMTKNTIDTYFNLHCCYPCLFNDYMIPYKLHASMPLDIKKGEVGVDNLDIKEEGGISLLSSSLKKN